MRALLQKKISCTGLLAVIAVVLIVLHFIASPAPARPWYENLQTPIIMAHQGGNREWPSCTMYAFHKAREAGSDVLDLDLHMTRDGVLVLIHDTTVNRTTDGQGAIAEMDWVEIAKLDAAYSFSTDRKSFPLRGKGIGIPGLVDVLETFPDWKIQMEVKQTPLTIAPKLAQVLKEHNAEDRVLLSCFDEEMMAELRLHCPRVATSATPNEIRNFVLAANLRLEGIITPKYSSLQVPLFAAGWNLVTPRIVEAAKNRGIYVLPWTIDRDADVEICRKAGVHGFNTNLPTKMERVRANWKRPGQPLFGAE